MAMNDENEYPRLTPPDDRYTARDRLLRKPEELTCEQFDLLAAAWSEGTLSGDHLSELDAAMASDPSMKLRAESFRSVRLVPCDDRWPGRNSLLKTAPETAAIRRTLFLTVAAAAAVIVLIMFGPSVIKQVTGKTTPAASVTTAIAEALIPESQPVIISGEKVEASAREIPGPETDPASSGPKTSIETTTEKAISSVRMEGETAVRDVSIPRETNTIPVTKIHTAGVSLMIAAAGDTHLRPVEVSIANTGAKQTSSSAERFYEPPSGETETNWIKRGFYALVKAITKEEKKIDGYFVASACVKGINNALGWEMELEQASNNKGEPVSVSFSSSLLSFSAPVNKTSQ